MTNLNINWAKLGRVTKAGVVLVFAMVWTLLLLVSNVMAAILKMFKKEDDTEEVPHYKKPGTMSYDERQKGDVF